jgi:multidrug resistance protein, MATE family
LQLDLTGQAAHVSAIMSLSNPEFSWRQHFAATYRLGLPLIGAQMAQMAIHATDIAMVGRIGAPELAATALATNYFFLIYMFGSGFLIALSPIVAQAFGANDPRAVRRSTRMGLWFAATYGVICVPALLAVEPVLLWLGQDARLAAIANDYMQIAIFGIVPALIFITFRSFLGAIDRASVLMWASFAAVALNALLNYIFIFGKFGFPAMGVPGSALGSVLTNIFIAIAVGLYVAFDAKAKTYEIFVRFWRADWPVLSSVLKLGLPISLTIMAETLMFQFASIMAGWLGVVQLAAHSIVMQLISFSFMVPLGLASAATIRVGQAIGGNNYGDANRAARAALYTAIGVAVVTILLFLTVPENLIRIFLAKTDPLLGETLIAAVPLLMIAAAFNLFDGTQAIAAGNLRGLKDTRAPMLIAIGSYWGLGMPLAYVFAFKLGLATPGIWLGLAVGLLATAILLNWRFFTKLAASAPIVQGSTAS